MSLPFDAYTRYYDLLYKDKDYAAEAAYVAAAIRRRVPQATRILELGCGTGGHAVEFARLGFDVQGIDLSDGMLERARARAGRLAPELAERLTFGHGDARSVRTGRTYDAVVSLFHVMSYHTGPSDLQAAYDTAAEHLVAGGVFAFDHWYGPAVLTQAPSQRVRRLADEAIHVTRIAEPVMHWQRNVCDVNYTLFIEDRATGALHQVQETHPMRYLFEPELALVERAGWRDAEARAWMRDDAPDATSWAALRTLTKA